MFEFCSLPVPKSSKACDEQPCGGKCRARRKIFGEEHVEDPSNICNSRGVGKIKCFVEAEDAGVHDCSGSLACCVEGRCVSCSEAHTKLNEEGSNFWFVLSTPEDPEMRLEDGTPKLITRSVFMDPRHDDHIRIVVLAERHISWNDRR